MNPRANPLLVAACVLSACAALLPSCTASANERAPEDARSRIFDSRHGHDRYYPPRGRAVPELPRDARPERWRGSTYYFHAGTWYRPSRSRFVIVRPPIGLTIAALPPFYTTIWVGSIPYYYANDIYYIWRPALRRYVVVDPPRDAPVSTGSTASQLYVYPRSGQSAEQQAADRYECHRWAVEETGFDTTQPAGRTAAERPAEPRAAYARAITACLEARGYSVR